MPKLDHRPRIALSAGHHNHTGGDAREVALTGPITRALAQRLREIGCDVRVITPSDGLGTFDGPLAAVVATVAAWAKAGWIADVFGEIHGEANGGGDAARGCFGIYADAHNGKDTDTETRDNLIPLIVKAITEATEIPARGNGRMSERKTAIGLSGQRLGVFAGTARYRESMRRLIVEVASYTSPADLALIHTPNYAERCGTAIANAIGEYFQLDTDTGAAPAQLRRYRVKVPRGARVRKQPNSNVTTPTLKILKQGDEWIGTPIERPDGYHWVAGTVAGHVRSDLLTDTGPA